MLFVWAILVTCITGKHAWVKNPETDEILFRKVLVPWSGALVLPLDVVPSARARCPDFCSGTNKNLCLYWCLCLTTGVGIFSELKLILDVLFQYVQLQQTRNTMVSLGRMEFLFFVLPSTCNRPFLLCRHILLLKESFHDLLSHDT